MGGKRWIWIEFGGDFGENLKWGEMEWNEWREIRIRNRVNGGICREIRQGDIAVLASSPAGV